VWHGEVKKQLPRKTIKMMSPMVLFRFKLFPTRGQREVVTPLDVRPFGLKKRVTKQVKTLLENSLKKKMNS